MNDTFGDIKGTAVIADDLLVYGEGDNMETATSDHDKNLRIVLERARERNLTLNKDKVYLRLTEVPYIGHLLTAYGLKPDPKKVEAIVMMPQPTDVQAVKRFLGMANYLSKFLPHLNGTGMKSMKEPLQTWSDDSSLVIPSFATMMCQKRSPYNVTYRNQALELLCYKRASQSHSRQGHLQPQRKTTPRSRKNCWRLYMHANGLTSTSLAERSP